MNGPRARVTPLENQHRKVPHVKIQYVAERKALACDSASSCEAQQRRGAKRRVQ